jgi:hypothetical protein
MTYQGGLIKDPATGTVHRHWTVPKSSALQLLDYFEQPELRSQLSVHQILRYVWKPPSFMRGRKNELAALAAFILTVDRIEGWNKL